jgi:CRISPR-associated protein Cmr1
MKARIPKQSEPPKVEERDDGRARQVRRYKVITPLFGGGAEPQQADAVTMVRGSEVRGHLRFWWRATRGGRFEGDLQAMRRVEEAIWGSLGAKGKAGPSSVIVAIPEFKETPVLEKVRNRRGQHVPVGDPGSPLSYVAFPLRPSDGQAGSLREEGIEFTLSLTFPARLEEPFQDLDVRQEVEAALWAWETFGGLGGRTRRGFGALQLLEVDGQTVAPPRAGEVERWVRSELAKHVPAGQWREGVPHLGPDATFVVDSPPCADAREAWEQLFNKLRTFRQARSKGSYGRSKWPEPDEIRRRTGTHASKLAPRHEVRTFPRGQFGLPIVFHFKDEKFGDPPESTLQGAEHERLASPLILRPLACAGGAVGLALRLEGPGAPPGGLVLRPKGGASMPVEVRLTRAEARQIDPLDGEPDVLTAFMNYLQERQRSDR